MVHRFLGVMILLSLFCVPAAVSQPAGNAEKPGYTLDDVDAKLKRQWESDEWSPESVALMKSVWEGLRKIPANPVEKEIVGVSNLGVPEPKSLADYEGSFGPQQNKDAKPAIEVFRIGDALKVRIRGQEIPAVVWNRSVLILSGDVVRSQTPSFGGKPHGALEMWLITCVKGKFYFLTLSGSSPATEIFKQ